LQPLRKREVMSVEILDARLREDASGSALMLSADDDGEVLRMEIRVDDKDYDTHQRGQSAISYLLGELGIIEPDGPDDLISKRIHRWAWDKVASIAAPKPRQLAVTPKPTPPTTETGGRFVYVISCEDTRDPLCKIGIANSPEKRLKQLSTSSPHSLRLELARYSPDASAVERAAHSHFSESRQNGEWFSLAATEAIRFVNDAIDGRQAA
jgi:hypothetical protein